MSRGLRYLLLTLVGLTVIIVDQATKYSIMESMRLHESIPIIPNLFSFTYIRNPGAAFGLLAGSSNAFRTVFFGVTSLFALALLGMIAGTGMMVSYWLHVNIVEVKAFILGLMTLHPVQVPRHPLFLVHLFLVMTLMLYFPFSKLMHAGGIFFSPSRQQPYQVQQRGRRYVNPLDR